MSKSWLVPFAVAATAALFMASSPPPRPAPPRVANQYADWLRPYIGKPFYVSADRTLATEKGRTAAVPEGAKEFTLAVVGEDFVAFENKTERVCIPLAVLRAVFEK